MCGDRRDCHEESDLLRKLLSRGHTHDLSFTGENWLLLKPDTIALTQWEYLTVRKIKEEYGL